jgi:hypothetical protein
MDATERSEAATQTSAAPSPLGLPSKPPRRDRGRYRDRCNRDGTETVGGLAHPLRVVGLRNLLQGLLRRTTADAAMGGERSWGRAAARRRRGLVRDADADNADTAERQYVCVKIMDEGRARPSKLAAPQSSLLPMPLQ